MTVEKVGRSSQGLRDMLFDELDRLRAGEVSPQRVNVLAKTVAQILSTVRLELDIMRTKSSLGKSGAMTILPISLGG